MEPFMELYFDDVFAAMDRDCLSARHKRRELVQYFSAVIAGCAKGHNQSDDESCRNFVKAALRFHGSCKSKNGEICLMGKYHNLLYVAMKLAFDWSLQDNGTVAALLDEIYSCEKTFERIFLGAIFGTSAPHFLAGWKSDFRDREENMHALVYFLDHATNASLEYRDGDDTFRFIDVPLESCGRAPPVRVVIQMGASEMLMILLRFGAKVTTNNASTNPIETILDRLMEYKRQYPYELVTCLKLILRAVPTIVLNVENKTRRNVSDDIDRNLNVNGPYNIQRKVILEKYGELLEDHLIPSSRCGLRPTELKHLCRCTVREALWKNFQLPLGIRQLPVPESMMKYLDICED